jgi:hypothetical protein
LGRLGPLSVNKASAEKPDRIFVVFFRTSYGMFCDRPAGGDENDEIPVIL